MLTLDLDAESYEPPPVESGTDDARRIDAFWAGARCHLYAARIPADRRPDPASMARRYAAVLRAEGAGEIEIESLFSAWSEGFDLAAREAADDATWDEYAARQQEVNRR